MEGVFHTYKPAVVQDLFNVKKRLGICSFLSEKAFQCPANWGYYAGGFRGVALEFEVPSEKMNEVSYVSFAEIQNCVEVSDLKKLLCRKLDCWEREQEWRFFHDSHSKSVRIGKLCSVYFGDPFKNLVNEEGIRRESESLRQYLLRRERLMSVSEAKGYARYYVCIDNSGVAFEEIKQ